MPLRDHRRTLVATLAAAAVIALACASGPPARADDPTLLLEVMINGHPTGKIGEFVLRDGVLLARAEELADLGLKVPRNAPHGADGEIALSALSGVSARLDAPTQTVWLTVPTAGLSPNVLTPEIAAGAGAPLQSATGATLNYDVVGTAIDGRAGASGLFDARLFSPAGVASTDFLAFAGPAANASTGLGASENPLVRLDSTYVYSDFAAQRRYWVGDIINGGLSWTRPVRLGGAQITHDFTMRPDLITYPVPSLSGSVAVPSTVNVLVNGSQLLSQQVQPGPFQAPQLPVISGAGSVQMTVTNALGQQVTTTVPFYAGLTLLKPGLQTWSLEAGFVRLDWGVVSNDYAAFAASGTWRRGLSDTLTVEAHAEGTENQVMAGGGIVADPFNFAVVNLGGAISASLGRIGGQVSLGVERVGRVFSFGAQAIIATPDFRDIAAMNGDPVPLRQISANVSAYLGRWGSVGLAWLQVDRDASADRVGIVGPPAGPTPPGVVGVGGAGLQILPAETSRVLTANYSVQLRKAYLYATGFHDFARGGGSGVSVGLTIPLGRRSSITAAAAADTGVPAYGQIQAQQSVVDIGDWGYQAYLSGPDNTHAFGLVQYKSPWALLSAGVDHIDAAATLRLEAQGAISFLDNRVFPSNTVDQSFAVVDTGLGGVRVAYENRPAGTTDAGGRLLVPDLRSWDVNHLSIEPADVPVDAEVPYTERAVRPPDRSGVVVDFPIRKTRPGLLILVDEAGRPIPLGSTATLEATGAVVPVGYDGQAFFQDLGPRNDVVVQLPNDGRCVVAFAYAPSPGDIPKLGPLTCRKDGQ